MFLNATDTLKCSRWTLSCPGDNPKLECQDGSLKETEMKWSGTQLLQTFFLLTFLNSFFLIFTVVNVQFLILSGHRDEGVTKFFLALITQNKYWHYPGVRGWVSRSKQEVLRELGWTGWDRRGCFCYVILKDLFFSLEGFYKGQGREGGWYWSSCLRQPKAPGKDKRKSMLHLHRSYIVRLH